jgi:hypothetical protein
MRSLEHDLILPGKFYGKVDHKMCTAQQRPFFFRTCSTASAVSHPPGCLSIWGFDLISKNAVHRDCQQ